MTENYCILSLLLITFATLVFMWLDLRSTNSEILRRLDGHVPVGERVAALERQDLAEDVGALVGRVDGLGKAGPAPPTARERAWVPCSLEGEHLSPESELPQELLDDLRRRYEATQPKPPTYEAVPRLGEDEERSGWQRDSGTWTKGEG